MGQSPGLPDWYNCNLFFGYFGVFWKVQMGAWYSPGILPMVYSGFPDDEETKKNESPNKS